MPSPRNNQIVPEIIHNPAIHKNSMGVHRDGININMLSPNPIKRPATLLAPDYSPIDKS